MSEPAPGSAPGQRRPAGAARAAGERPVDGLDPQHPAAAFEREVRRNVERLGSDAELRALSLSWAARTAPYKYTYNFRWLGRPIIQFPQDIIAMQELIWSVRPQLVIETGVAHGGSLVFYASMLELIGGVGLAVGIDVDIREHNRAAIEQHPMSRRIRLIEGSSTSAATLEALRPLAQDAERVLVVLDSDHTHAHVLRELELYSPLVRKGGYLVVFDTIIEDMDDAFWVDRPWGRGNNPKTAVREFLSRNDRFVVDREIEARLQITVAPEGYLQCIRD
ncbi:MAG TPA: cephalosporin hydroxylase family protein [Planctomycetota bacterium]|nr:cephalosporin hydroxylase family protein [Planctomycetota bacterium]